ncbi:mitochondrial fission ELM1 family protein [uncultured Salinisphaera sp.]|uniref:mitochondrial fission ELM1 family protein n=1 Tax=uncultured Salinisphaera sp. TaxID=359372 RepID=UPI0032B140C1
MSAEHHVASVPRVWVLLGEGAGGNAQMLALAEALAKTLGWSYQTHQLRWNTLNHLPNPLIGARAFTLARDAAPLEPPWPDLVIAASRRSAPIARWIKRCSGGRTRLVHLLHTQMSLHTFDLVITTAQFRVPDAPNVLRTTLPLNVISPERLAEAGQRWARRLAHLPRPWTAVLVGGDSSSHRLDTAVARRLADRANTLARAEHGSLLVTTSKRTRQTAADALAERLALPYYCHRWCADDTDNPYPAFLALADRFLVTADSASMPAEAAATGRPVSLFEWPAKRAPRSLPAMVKPIHRALVYEGWHKPRRDFTAFHQGLREAGLIDTARPAAPPADMARAVAAISRLMGRRPPDVSSTGPAS